MTAERYNRPALTWRCMICKWWCQIQMKIYWKPDVKENWQCGLFPCSPLFLRVICKWTWTPANCGEYCAWCVFGDIPNKYFCKLLLDIMCVLSHYWSYCYFSHKRSLDDYFLVESFFAAITLFRLSPIL